MKCEGETIRAFSPLPFVEQTVSALYVSCVLSDSSYSHPSPPHRHQLGTFRCSLLSRLLEGATAFSPRILNVQPMVQTQTEEKRRREEGEREMRDGMDPSRRAR